MATYFESKWQIAEKYKDKNYFHHSAEAAYNNFIDNVNIITVVYDVLNLRRRLNISILWWFVIPLNLSVVCVNFFFMNIKSGAYIFAFCDGHAGE